MALTPQSNDAFFREVDDELRRDRLTGFWLRWGRLVAAAVVVALIVFAGYLWWKHSREEAAGRDGEALVGALETAERGQPDKAVPALKALATANAPGYRASSALAVAAIQQQKGDTKAALAGYRAVAADTGLAAPFRNLALIRATAIEFDSLPPAEVVARLKPLAVAGNPWFGSAGEMTAVAYLKMNRTDLAGPLFGAIARDTHVPDTIRNRATQMAGALGVDAVASSEGSN